MSSPKCPLFGGSTVNPKSQSPSKQAYKCTVRPHYLWTSVTSLMYLLQQFYWSNSALILLTVNTILLLPHTFIQFPHYYLQFHPEWMHANEWSLKCKRDLSVSHKMGGRNLYNNNMHAHTQPPPVWGTLHGTTRIKACRPCRACTAGTIHAKIQFTHPCTTYYRKEMDFRYITLIVLKLQPNLIRDIYIITQHHWYRQGRLCNKEIEIGIHNCLESCVYMLQCSYTHVMHIGLQVHIQVNEFIFRELLSIYCR